MLQCVFLDVVNSCASSLIVIQQVILHLTLNLFVQSWHLNFVLWIILCICNSSTVLNFNSQTSHLKPLLFRCFRKKNSKFLVFWISFYKLRIRKIFFLLDASLNGNQNDCWLCIASGTIGIQTVQTSHEFPCAIYWRMHLKNSFLPLEKRWTLDWTAKQGPNYWRQWDKSYRAGRKNCQIWRIQ